MNHRIKNSVVRTAVSVLLTALTALAPWPAWAQTARIVAPVTIGGTAAGASATATLESSPSGLTPNVSLLAAPSITVDGAPLPLAGSFVPAALVHLGAANAASVSHPEAPSAFLAPAALKPVLAAASTPDVPAASAKVLTAQEQALAGKTVVMVGTKGSRPFIMQEALRVAKELGLNLVLVDDAENRKNSLGAVPDSHFIAAPIGTHDEKAMGAIADAVAAHPEGAKAHAVVGFMSLYASLTGKVTDRLGALGVPGEVLAAADNKPEMRLRLNSDPTQRVEYAVVSSVKEAREAYARISEGGKHKVMLKTVRGENSRFLDLNIKTENEAASSYLKMDAAVRDFVARPEAKGTTFETHPGIMMERMIVKTPGTEETSVEVVMQGGKAAFAMMSDTKGIGQKGQLAGGILVFPSQEPTAMQAEIVKAAEAALAALGLTDGSARLDMFMTPDGPRVIEINPFMGSVAIWQAVKSLTGMSLVEQGFRAVLGLPVDPGHAPDGVVHYVFLASSRNGTLESVEGVDAARKLPGVELARVFVEKGDTIVAAKDSTYEEWGEVIGKGKTWREAIAAALSGARRMSLRIKRANGEIVGTRGDYQQPNADDLAPLPKQNPPAADSPAVPAASQPAPGLWSKVVMGFLSTFLLVSTAVESTSLAVSQMTQPLSQGFLALAALTSVSYGAYTIGSFMGGTIVKKFGIRATYRAVLLARTLIWTSLALLFNPATGTIALFALIPLFSLDYFFHSIGRVAEHSLQVAWYKNDEVKSSRFGSFRDFIEYGTVFIGSAMALAIAAWGFGAVIFPAPFAFGLAALLALGLALPKAEKIVGAAVGTWKDGVRVVVKDSSIWKPLVGFALVNSFLYMMYYIVATAFGAYATSSPEQAAGVAGSLTAVYGVGALVGALYMDRMAKKLDAKVELLPESERRAGKRRLYAQSAARVLPWAAVALLGSWLLTSSLQLGTLIWPMFPVSIALLAIGFTAQLASNHLDTIMKSNIPSDRKDVTVGAIRGLIYLTHVFGFLLWGGLFAWLGVGAFAAFAAFYTGVAAIYLWLARSLNK